MSHFSALFLPGLGAMFDNNRSRITGAQVIAHNAIIIKNFNASFKQYSCSSLLHSDWKNCKQKLTNPPAPPEGPASPIGPASPMSPLKPGGPEVPWKQKENYGFTPIRYHA